MITHCKSAGIPIRAQSDQIMSLLYPLVPAILQANDQRSISLNGSIDLLLELIAAFCLGEVKITPQKRINPRVRKRRGRSMDLTIETEDLGKRYGALWAVEHLSLRVDEGEIYAFLGLNGAGKTTTIRMLLGMIRPTTGSANVLHTRVRLGSREPWGSVGYMVEIPHSYPELTVYENLEAAAACTCTPKQAVSSMIERLGLAAYVDPQDRKSITGKCTTFGFGKSPFTWSQPDLFGRACQRPGPSRDR